ncbi:heavy-metal-associated domain-containing protein [Eleftheria terrae]|uniref:heavy-metal-associated domain-containing protein n=1 Tax=Eleftheria terrae TaxID=1597781 RepID=UPI00263AB121|nr:heavy-metal-associated domain-containing protein [Eleftheria terrae]WKB54009.1 heavy-metal-associated domain-containing protein [Eleftheria terrae]
MIEFSIPAMSCGHCASAVARALGQADPQAQVDIDLRARTVRITSREQAAALAQALAEAGYPPA